jgi:hypothetical protein
MTQKSKLDSEESMRKEIEIMNGFGSRATGSKGHQEFIAWLKQQLEDMGLPIYSYTYPFERWEEKRSALKVNQEIFLCPQPIHIREKKMKME